MKFRNVVLFRWKPGRDLLALGASYLAVLAGLSTATFIVTPERGFLYFLAYGVLTAALLGVGIPLWWTTRVKGRSVGDLGITAKGWKLSLGLQALLLLPQLAAAAAACRTAGAADLPPLIALALAVGLFEAIFWRGWVLGRLEKSFGLVPAILGASALYALYHGGYGMGWTEIGFLFLIGLMFSVLFAVTRSILVLWPVLQPSGQLITVAGDGLRLPPAALVGFLEVLALMVALIVYAELAARRRLRRRASCLAGSRPIR